MFPEVSTAETEIVYDESLVKIAVVDVAVVVPTMLFLSKIK